MSYRNATVFSAARIMYSIVYKTHVLCNTENAYDVMIIIVQIVQTLHPPIFWTSLQVTITVINKLIRAHNVRHCGPQRPNWKEKKHRYNFLVENYNNINNKIMIITIKIIIVVIQYEMRKLYPFGFLLFHDALFLLLKVLSCLKFLVNLSNNKDS